MILRKSWWRHQMETFSALLVLYAGNTPVSGEFPAQRAVTRSFDVFFDLCLNKRLSKQSWGWWFETLSRPLWRHCNGIMKCRYQNAVQLFQAFNVIWFMSSFSAIFWFYLFMLPIPLHQGVIKRSLLRHQVIKYPTYGSTSGRGRLLEHQIYP